VPAPDPEEIYRRVREEGRRRLRRPPIELAATALVGGFDVAFGVVALGLADATLRERFGPDVAHLGGSIAFGIGFVFVVVGRSELFTENFLVPIAGLERRDRDSLLKLGELWAGTLVLNLAGGAVLALLLTSRSVLSGTHGSFVDLAEHLTTPNADALFLSAVVAGALMTLMTWFVEGAADAIGVRIVMSWLVGSLIALGFFNHAIVSTIELVFGARSGAPVGFGDVFQNLALAVAGNLAGGLGLVTFARWAQALGVGGKNG
jgi:formate/nitrite transporter FocA (FNT family)